MNRELVELLAHGRVDSFGTIPDASNTALLVSVERGDQILRAVLKPVSGESPLIDFPDGTLAAREAASFVLADWLGMDCIPPTVLREDLDYLSGSLQAFVVQDAGMEVARAFESGQVPAEWEPVFAAQTQDGRKVIVAHHRNVRGLAFFDLLANNADRKGSHVYYGDTFFAGAPSDARGPHVYGIDNGLCFHTEPKLRTVLWGFAGEPFTATEHARLDRLHSHADELTAKLRQYLTGQEIAALLSRAEDLAELGEFPDVPEDRYPLPWPPL